MLVAAGGLLSGRRWAWTAVLLLWGVAALKSLFDISTGTWTWDGSASIHAFNMTLVVVALIRSNNSTRGERRKVSPTAD